MKLRESTRTKGNQTPETSELEVIVRHYHYSDLSFYVRVGRTKRVGRENEVWVSHSE